MQFFSSGYVIYSSYLVAKNVCKTFPSHTRHLKKKQVFVIVSTQFFLGFLIAMAYRYVFVPWFRGTEDDILRTIIAMITPILMDDSSYRLNFDLGKKNEIHHYS